MTKSSRYVDMSSIADVDAVDCSTLLQIAERDRVLHIRRCCW